MNKFDLPTGKEYLKEFINKTILPAKKKQSNTLFFVKGTGRNSLLKHITQNTNDILTLGNDNLKDVIILTIDSKDRDLILGNWKKMLKDQKITLENPKDINALELIEKLTKEMNKRLLLCVWVFEDGVDLSFLETIRQVNAQMIDFQFAFPFEVEHNEIKNYLGSLTQFALQNMWHMPLYSDEDIRVVINNQLKLGFAKVNESQVKDILTFSGGYPRLARYFLRNIENIKIDSWNTQEVRHFFDEIWDGLKDKTKECIFRLTIEKNFSCIENKFLLETGLVQRDKKNWKMFSPLFDEYVSYLSKSRPPAVISQEGKIKVNGVSIELLLSNQEQQVFQILFNNKGVIIEREKIARIMWGDDWEEKYSNWAIDQIISRIRNKLNDRSKLGLVKTVRGKGFFLEI